MFHFHIDKTMVIPLGENANTDGAVLVHHDSLLLGKEHQPQNCKAVQAQYHAEFDKLNKLIDEKKKEFDCFHFRLLEEHLALYGRHCAYMC